MSNTLSTINIYLNWGLVILGVLIIISGAVKTIWEVIGYEKKKKEMKAKGEDISIERDPIFHSHFTLSIILALPLFMIKLLTDSLSQPTFARIIYLLGLAAIFAFLAYFFFKKPDSREPTKNKKVVFGSQSRTLVATVVVSVIISSLFASAIGFWAGQGFPADLSFTSLQGKQRQNQHEQNLNDNFNNPRVATVGQESAVVDAVEKVSPAVVSIIVSKDLPKIERFYSSLSPRDNLFNRFFGDNFFNFQIPQYRENGTEKQEIGGGTGFIVSADGYIVTNKHVVADEEADYTVLMNDENKYDAQVIARDPASDLAVLKIDANDLPVVEFGSSKNLKVGQTVIAIGNALGEFTNTVSAGVISGLSRSIVAGGSSLGSERLNGVIQTDASINPGNSGGPLLNIAGQVIGINTAIASGAQNIGFAIPIDEVKNTIENVQEHGKLIRPWLGVRYIMINDELVKANNLDVDHGALVVRGEQRTDLAVIPGSPADKAGLEENDIILEVNGQKLDEDNTLIQVIGKFSPSDTITLKIMHQGEEKKVKVTLKELKS